ncbi:MAG: C10 family peptidase, partial [Deltaproteobacteria bacterium]|nr:C10 family peptidase [Deltaproteobacteria bacterium]
MNDNTEITQWIKEELFKINKAIKEHEDELSYYDLSETKSGKLWNFLNQDRNNFEITYPSFTEGMDFTTYGPLLSTAWGQGDPYNQQTPKWCNGASTYTGCVATAAAQIMKYWNYPQSGQNSTSYQWWNGCTWVTLSRDFSQSTYDWANMLNSYSSGSTQVQKDAVAKLMSDVGIAWHMDYGVDGSGADTMYGLTVYPTYFKYKNTIQAVYRINYSSDSAWMQVFRDEVQAGRPCHMRIRDPNAGGHSVVVDGYRDSPSEQIHINMGWEGYYDGWYASNHIVTGSYSWSDVNYQAALIGIEPEGLTPGKATLVSPSGTIDDNTPTYTWNEVDCATEYYLWVNG